MPNQAPPPGYQQPMAYAGPRVINDYQAGDPIPPGYHPSTKLRGWAIGAGLGMFGAAYLPSVFVAAIASDICDTSSSCRNPAWPLWIPVVGPFVAIGTYGASSATVNVFLVIDGLLQTAGAALTIYGFAAPKTVLVRNDMGSLQIAPTMVAGTAPGIGFSGTFF